MTIATRITQTFTSCGRFAIFGIGSMFMLVLVSCAEMPSGPTVAVMPAPNKPFEIFVQDEQLCRSWAAHSIGLAGHDAAARQMLNSTVTGTAIGAIAGAVAGGHRDIGAGAAIGTVVGATAGANQSTVTAWSAQRRYDIAYQQCMYSRGNFIVADAYGYKRNLDPKWTPSPPPR